MILGMKSEISEFLFDSVFSLSWTMEYTISPTLSFSIWEKGSWLSSLLALWNKWDPSTKSPYGLNLVYCCLLQFKQLALQFFFIPKLENKRSKSLVRNFIWLMKLNNSSYYTVSYCYLRFHQPNMFREAIFVMVFFH